jgi:hypothetical protein
MHAFLPRRLSSSGIPRVCWFTLISLSLTWNAHVAAQRNAGQLGGVEPSGQYPSPQYYVGLDIYRTGDLEAAIDAFDGAMRGTRRDINGRWIDAIPVLAMLAECHWQAGDVATAREHVDQVFQIAIRNSGWLGRVDWPAALQPGLALAVPGGLWPEASAVRLVPVADKLMYSSGKPLTEQDLVRGGVIEELNLRTMDLVEIMRGLAVAAHRRRVILGPLAEQDPLASALLDATKYPAGLQIPIARTLIGSLRSSEYFSIHDDKRVLEGAEAAWFNGGAHPLSAIAMLSQVSALAGSEKPESAVALAINLVHLAAALEQPEWIGEAMQLAAGCASEQQAASVRQAAAIVATSMLRDSRLATLHCLIAGADAAVTAGDLDSAATMLSQAQSLTARRDVTQPRLEAYGAYVAARLAAARGSSVGVLQGTPLDEAIARVSSFAIQHRNRSQSLVSTPRGYQLGLVGQAIGKSLGGNTSDKLLQAYCEDPPAQVWRRDPVDGLSGVLIDRAPAHAARVNLAAAAGYADKLLQAVDAMLAARFNQQLPLGGRISQVRALACGDERTLDPPLLEFREKAGRGMKDLRAAVQAMGEPNAIQAEAAEAQACSIALGRLHLPQTAPRLLNEKLPIATLPPRTALITFTFVSNKLLATLSADGKTVAWDVAGASRLSTEIGRLLKEIGVGKVRGNRLPKDSAWKETAVTLRRQLFPDEASIQVERFDDWIIVPDGPLWYLPFELLPVSDAASPLIADRLRVRYAATPGLALKPIAGPPAIGAVGLSAELFFAPRDLEANAATVQSILDVLTDPIRLPEAVETPSGLLGNRIGHLVVASPRAPHPKNHLLTALAPYDQSSPYGTLDGWMRFPAEVPRSVVLFGYRTPVDAGQVGTGQEMFNTLCALNVAGVSSVVLSRWAVGGESSAIALRELLQELPIAGMNQSWLRARMLLRRSELDPAAEPLLPQADHERDGLTGDEPLFWASYLVSSPDPVAAAN